jgi:hypothetical protein
MRLPKTVLDAVRKYKALINGPDPDNLFQKDPGEEEIAEIVGAKMSVADAVLAWIDVHPIAPKPAKVAALKVADPSVSIVMKRYESLWRAKHGNEPLPPQNWPMIGRQTKALLLNYGEQRVLQMLKIYVVEGDLFWAKQGFPWSGFYSSVPRLALATRGPLAQGSAADRVAAKLVGGA